MRMRTNLQLAALAAFVLTGGSAMADIFALATERENRKLVSVDLTTNVITTVFNTPDSPDTLVLLPSGKFSYSLPVANQIRRFDPVTNADTLVADSTVGIISPQDIVVDPTGQFLYVSNLVGITKTNLAGPFPNATLFTNIDNPEGIAFDSTGRMFILAGYGTSNSGIYQLNPTTGAVLQFNAGFDQADQLDALVFDSFTNKLYATSSGAGGSNAIYSIDPATLAAVKIATVPSPDGITSNSHGLLYVASRTGGANCVPNPLAVPCGAVYSVNTQTFVVTKLTDVPTIENLVIAPSTVITANPVNFSAVAGVSFTTPVATFTDSNAAATPADFTATINWGDGTTSTGTITELAPVFTVTGTHTYAMSGQDSVIVTISDVPPGTGTATVTDTATVASQGTVITANPVNFNAVAGMSFTTPVATFTDSNAAATPASFTATINWGDGTTSTGTITELAQVFTVTGTHTYAMSGQDTVTVTIFDVAPGTGTATVTDKATVAAATLMPPTLTKSFANSEIQLFGLNSTALSFTLTDPNTTTTLTGLAFTDTLPSGLIVSTPNGLTGSCGGGTITAIASSSSISLSGGTLAAGASCTFSVNVTGTAIGVQTNTTSTVTSNEAPPGAPATASTSDDALFLFLWFFS